jgi:molybdenum cofactor biosynthesis protein B
VDRVSTWQASAAMSDPPLGYGTHEQSAAAHRAAAPASVRCAVLTVSDTRTPDTDLAGDIIRETLGFAGHAVVDYRIVLDEPAEIREVVAGWIARRDVQAILSNGGTGIATRDTTYDALAGMLDKRIDGFGELFRMLSWQEVGAAAMLSRAVAGVASGTLIIAMPGSPKAVRLAMTKLIVPELGHLVYEIAK